MGPDEVHSILGLNDKERVGLSVTPIQGLRSCPSAGYCMMQLTPSEKLAALLNLHFNAALHQLSAACGAGMHCA